MLSCFDAEAEAPSVTLTVKVNVPAASGVPVIKPEAVSDNPPGSAPAAIVQVYGGVPPLTFSDCEYGAPGVPDARLAVVMEGAAAIVMVTASSAWLPALSLT